MHCSLALISFLRVLVMVSQLIFLVLALVKAVIVWREAAGEKGARLMDVLIRDQALYLLLYVLRKKTFASGRASDAAHASLEYSGSEC